MADDLPLHWILHEIDEESVRHESALSKLPGLRKAQEARIAVERRKLDTATSRAAECKTKRTLHERDIAVFEEQEKKFRKQLDAVTDQKQFEAVQHEIAAVAAKRSALETDVLTIMDEEETLEAARPALQDALDKAAREGAALTEKLAAEEASARSAIAILDARRAEHVTRFDAPSRTRYERTRTSRAGRAVAAIDKDACGACFSGLAPSVMQVARRHERLLICDGCGRMLMLPPDGAGAA